MRNLKTILQYLKSSIALFSICEIFDGDEHRIISRKGLEILNKKNNGSKERGKNY